MPDCTKCTNILCPVRDKCHRYTCQSSLFMQSYSNFEYNHENNSCDHFIDNRNNDHLPDANELVDDYICPPSTQSYDAKIIIEH